MTDNATHTGLVTIPGTDIGLPGVLIAFPQTQNMQLTLSDRITFGPRKVRLDGDGYIVDPGLQTPIKSGLLWELAIQFDNRQIGNRGYVTLGVFNLNTSGDIKDLVTDVPTSLTADDYEAIFQLIDDLASYGAISDGTIAANINSVPSTATQVAGDARWVRRPFAGRNPLTGMYHLDGYGAVGNGATDSTTAFTTAITDASNAGGGRVHLPWTAAGYRLGTFTLPSNVSLVGEVGRRTGLKKIGASSSFFLNLAGVTKVNVENIDFDANGLTSSADLRMGVSGGIGASYITVKNCSFTNSGSGIVSNIDIQSTCHHIDIDDSVWFNTPRLVGTGAVTFTDAGDLVGIAAHGLAVGDVVTFTGAITTTTGVTAGSHYFVRKVPTTGTFTLSPTLPLAAKAVSFTASNDRVTWTSHGLPIGQPVMFDSVTGVVGVTANTVYYVRDYVSSSQFTLSATPGGALLDITTDGTGTTDGAVVPLTNDGSGTGLSYSNDLLNGIKINGNVANLRIRRPRISGWRQRGIWALSTAGAAMQNALIERADIYGMVPGGASRQPIAIQGVDTGLHADLEIIGCHVTGDNIAYNDTYLAGTADLISVHRTVGLLVRDCVVVNGGDVGITIAEQCRHVRVIGNEARNCDSTGISIGSATSDPNLTYGFTVTGNECINNGQARDGVPPTWARSGINVNKATHVMLASNELFDDQAVPTQNYATYWTAATGTIGPNRTWGNALGVYGNDGTSTITFNIADLVMVASADTTVNNSAVLVDVTGFSATLDGNATYELYNARIVYNTATPTPDMDIKWSGPAGASMDWSEGGAGGGTTTAGAVQIAKTNRALSATVTLGGTGANIEANPVGTIKTGAAGGTFKLQMAQTVAAASDTIIRGTSTRAYLKRVA